MNTKEIIAAVNLDNLRPLREAVKRDRPSCSECDGEAYCVVFHHGKHRDGAPPQKAIKAASGIIKNAARTTGQDPIAVSLVFGELNKDLLVHDLTIACRAHAPDSARSSPSSCGICDTPGLLTHDEAVLFSDQLSFFRTENGEKFFVICDACRDLPISPEQAISAARKKWDPRRPKDDPHYPDFAQMIWDSVYAD